MFTALYIYVFYRTNKTVVNQLMAWIFPPEKFAAVRQNISQSMPLPKWVVFTLPEALWVFCATLLSKNLFFTIKKYPVKCLYLPIFFAFLWEVLQLTGITNGYFDYADLLGCTLAFLLAKFFLRLPYAPLHLIKHFSPQAIFFFAIFVVVYLSHVVS